MEQDVAMLRWYDGYDQQCIVDDKEQNEDAALEAIRQTYQADNLIWMRQAAPTTALIQALLEQIHSIGVLQQLTFCNVSTNTHVDAWESFFDALRCNRIWIHTILLSTHLCDKSWEWIDRLCTVLQYNRSVTQLRLGPVHAESNADPQTGRASMHVRQSLCRMLRLRQDTLNLNVFDACWWFGEDGIDPETNQPSLAQWACVQRGLLRLYSTHIPSTWSNMKQHTFHRVHIIAHREYANHEQAMTRFLLNNEIQNLYILGQPHGLLFEVYHRLCDPSLATTYLATHLQTVHLMRDAIRKQDRTEMQLADATYYRIPGLTQHVTNVLSKDRMQHLTADRSLWPQLSAIAVYYADELKYLPPLLEARPLIHTLSIHVLEGSNPFEIPADSSRQIAASHITCLHVTHLHGSAFHWLSDILFQPQCCIHTLILEDFDGITDLQWDMFFEPHVIHSLQAFVLANIFKPTSAVVGLFAALFRKLPCLPRLRIVPLPMHMSPRAQAALQQKLSWKEADMERINTLILSRQLHYVLTRDAWQQMACVFLWFTTLRDHTLQNSVIQFHYGIRRLLGGACVSDIDFAIEEMYDYEYVLQQHLWIVCQQEQQSLALFQRYPLDLFVLRDCAFVQSLFDAPQERVTAPSAGVKRKRAVAVV